MIITISGANFSASNIGTLSTWTVSKSIGAGAEHSIPSYVDKNSAFNYTITLKDGYTFGTYSVTMGGQKITPTVTETSITINIASVTGAIKIEVKTINSSTGEEDKPVTPEEPGTGGGSGETPSTITITQSDIVQGGWAYYEPLSPSAANRIRTNELIDVTAGSTITVDVPDTLAVAISVLKADGSTTKDTNDWIYRSLWTDRNTTIDINEDGKLHFTWKKSNDSNLTPSDFAGTYTINIK